MNTIHNILQNLPLPRCKDPQTFIIDIAVGIYCRSFLHDKGRPPLGKRIIMRNMMQISHTILCFHHIGTHGRYSDAIAQLHMPQLVFFKNLQVNPFFLSFLLSHCILPTFASDFQFHCE